MVVSDGLQFLLEDILSAEKNEMSFKSKSYISKEVLDYNLRIEIYNLIISRRGNAIFTLAPMVASVIKDHELFNMILDGILSNFLNNNSSTIAVIEFIKKNKNNLDIEKMENIYSTSDEQFKLFLRNIKQLFSTEFNLEVYNESGDLTYLPEDVKDIFIF